MFRKILLFIVSLLVASIWYISPIMKVFPALKGAYQVGRETLYFLDQKRAESFSDNVHDKRVVVGHVFFPTDNVKGLKQASYLGSKAPVFREIFSNFFNLPQWLTKLFFPPILTHAYLDASLSKIKDRYPVILFSHGLLGSPSDMYTVFLEELASQGYIVMGIDHPYFNLITLYADGKKVSCNALMEAFAKMSSIEQKKFQSKAIEIYKADIKYILDDLELINQDVTSMFYKRLDLEHIGIMGHSAGGTAAIEFCRNNDQCKAVIDLDGWYDKVIGSQPLRQPTLLIFGSKSIEISEPTSAYLNRKGLTRMHYFENELKIAKHREEFCKAPHCSMIVLPNVLHGDFGDEILLKWPFRHWDEADSYKTISCINEQILNFFNKNLH